MIGEHHAGKGSCPRKASPLVSREEADLRKGLLWLRSQSERDKVLARIRELEIERGINHV